MELIQVAIKSQVYLGKSYHEIPSGQKVICKYHWDNIAHWYLGPFFHKAFVDDNVYQQ